jgi:hypothetical protein
MTAPEVAEAATLLDAFHDALLDLGYQDLATDLTVACAPVIVGLALAAPEG